MHPVGNGLGATVTPLDLLPPPLVLPAATSYWQVAFFCVGVPPESFLTRLFPNEVTSNSIAGRPAVHPGQWCCMRQKQRGRTSGPGPHVKTRSGLLAARRQGVPGDGDAVGLVASRVGVTGHVEPELAQGVGLPAAGPPADVVLQRE